MPERKFKIAELEAILELPADHPRRRQLETDPRFRAAVHAYQQFLDLAQALPDPEMISAEERLGEFVDKQVFSGAKTTSGFGYPAPVRRWWQSRWLRPVFACCLLVVAAASFYSVYEPGGPEPGRSINLRAGTATHAEPAGLQHISMETTADGSVRVAWRVYAGAETYRLVVIGPDLVPVGTFTAGADISFTIPAAEVARLRDLEPSLVVRVEALVADDPIGHSPALPWPTTD